MKDVHRQEARDLIEKGAQVVEVLPSEEFAEDHIPGAINLPLRKIETDAGTELDPTRSVVLYCWDSA
jgi:rhodanese-related sulfurtransferase